MNKLMISSAALLITLSQTAAADHLTEYIFPLTVGQTNPPATIPAGVPEPSGLAKVMIDSNAMTIAWDVDYQDLTGPIVAPGAHFHGPAALGSNASVEIFLTDGNPPEPASGNLSGTAALDAQQLSDVLDGLWYLNVHTADNMSGEIRGQVLPVIPEPASISLILVTALTFLSRRRQR